MLFLIGLAIGFVVAVCTEAEFYEETGDWKQWAIEEAAAIAIVSVLFSCSPFLLFSVTIGNLIGRVGNWLVSDDYF